MQVEIFRLASDIIPTWTSRGKVHNFWKCAGLLVAQITSLTEGYLLLSEDPVQGGKMEWSQEREGRKTAGKERTYDVMSDSGQASRRPTVFPKTSTTKQSK